MGSRHRSAVTTSMPLTPITLITEVRSYYITECEGIASRSTNLPFEDGVRRFMMGAMAT